MIKKRIDHNKASYIKRTFSGMEQGMEQANQEKCTYLSLDITLGLVAPSHEYQFNHKPKKEHYWGLI
jgi:hypothetical protein